MGGALLIGIIPLAIAMTILSLEAVDRKRRASSDPKQAKHRTIRFTIWGAVAGVMITTAITIVIANNRVRDPAWASRPSAEEVRAVGLWIGLPAGALSGAIGGFALSRRERTRL
jgi:hypothetical protein